MIPAGLTQGTLGEISFPQLLWKIVEVRLTGVLEISRKEVRKKIFFDGGYPVHAESNLLHETFGKFLLTEKLITSDQEQSLLVKSLEAHTPLYELIVEDQLMDAAAVSEALKKNFALKILDCFSWDKGNFTCSEDTEFQERILSLKMNPIRLLLHGIENHYPLGEIIRKGFEARSKAFQVASKSQVDPGSLALNQEEIRFLNLVKQPKTVPVIEKEASLSKEAVIKKLFAFCMLGLVQEEASTKTELSLDELVGATLLQSLKPAEAPTPIAETDEETQQLANEIAENHMKLMNQNYFELFELAEDATAVAIRDAFIAFSSRYGPNRFSNPQLGEFRMQGEEIFLRGVKAYGVLSEFERKTKYIDKLKAERKKAEPGKKKAGEAFKIQTTLLNGDAQFQKGKRLLSEKNFTKAIEQFEYATDIEASNGTFLAHLGWAKYEENRERNRKEAEEMLVRAVDLATADGHPEFFLGKFLCLTDRHAAGLEKLKAAVERSPKNIDFVRELRNTERTQK